MAGASGVKGLHVFGNAHDKVRWSISNQSHYASTDRSNVERCTVNIRTCYGQHSILLLEAQREREDGPGNAKSAGGGASVAHRLSLHASLFLSAHVYVVVVCKIGAWG